MPKPDVRPAGAPCWIELFSSDPAASEQFYGSLFDWKVQDPGPDYGGYRNFLKDDELVAGFMANDGSTGQPDGWNLYLTTDDIEAVAASAPTKGAQVFVPPMAVHALGSMAVMSDPTGATVGAWQPNEMPGFGVLAEPGAPAWFELHTTDYDAAVRFYRDVFGWETHSMSDSPEFRYTTLGEGDAQAAGIMDAATMGATTSFWTIYFNVEDADATLAKIEALGGKVVDPAQDTPYGRLATAADPTGATFRLQQP
jgi:predicted enzyme related to lactoylglutathione lyase